MDVIKKTYLRKGYIAYMPPVVNDCKLARPGALAFLFRVQRKPYNHERAKRVFRASLNCFIVHYTTLNLSKLF